MRLGIDVVHISRIEESLAAFGERFMRRLFTPDEVAYATSVPELCAQRLAARFAAKEAALKAFGLCEAGVDWRELEVRRRPDGACELTLHGKARCIAGTERAQLSLSHDGDYAMAVVAAELADSVSLPSTLCVTP